MIIEYRGYRFKTIQSFIQGFFEIEHIIPEHIDEIAILKNFCWFYNQERILTNQDIIDWLELEIYMLMSEARENHKTKVIDYSFGIFNLAIKNISQKDLEEYFNG